MKSKPLPPISFRPTQIDADILRRLGRKLKSTPTDIIRRALSAYADKVGIQ